MVISDPRHTGCSNLTEARWASDICNHENNVPSRLSPQCLCGNSCTWAHDVRLHHVRKCMSCHKAIVVITGRAHFFHDYICIFILVVFCKKMFRNSVALNA